MDTLVLLKGNHTTLIKGIGPHELYEDIEECAEFPFVFLQDADVETPNRVCVAPGAVVGLIAVPGVRSNASN